MPDGWGPALNSVGVVSGCLILVYLFVTDRICSGKRLLRAELDRDKWEKLYLDIAQSSKSAILPAAEAVHALVSNLPDPGAERAEDQNGAP
jgi:hypothetical protein